jgi:hypothetical protein
MLDSKKVVLDYIIMFKTLFKNQKPKLSTAAAMYG